jgi:hypothetical protein
MEIMQAAAQFVSHLVGLAGLVIALSAAVLAEEHHDQLKKLEEKVDYLADQLYEVKGAGDVPGEREDRH